MHSWTPRFITLAAFLSLLAGCTGASLPAGSAPNGYGGSGMAAASHSGGGSGGSGGGGGYH